MTALVLSGMAWGSQANIGRGTARAGLQPITVQLNWRHQFEFAAFYAAIEQGYYRAAGLHVDLIEGGPEIDPVDAVVQGRAEFGVANSSLVLDHAQGRPVVALAALMQHSAFALLAWRDRGIESVSDLDGKTVSCAPHACDEIRAYLKASGLHEAHVRYVAMKSTVVEENFAYSDATDIFVSNQGFQILGREDQYILLTPRSAGIDLYGDILFTADDQLAESPDTVAAFRAATAQGLQYAMKHQDELIELILARYNTQGKTRASLAYEAAKLFELTRPDLVEPGYMSRGRWQHVRDVYADLGMLPADYPVENMLYQPEVTQWPAWVSWLLFGLTLALAVSALVALYLRRINTRLHTEIHQRTQAEIALQAGQENFRRFVEQANSLIAHELRTPLSVLQTHLGVIELKQGAGNGSSKNLDAMKQAISRLQVLFDKNLAQVFASTRFESREKKVDLDRALDRLIADHAVLLPQSQIRCHIQRPGMVVPISPEMFDTAMINLLENAEKYSVPETGVDVRVAEEEGFALIEVSNTTAIPMPDDPETLFAKHARGHSGDDIVGTGVGLHLVRLIAETHGGSARIRVDHAQLDSAHRFTVQLRFPLAPSAGGVATQVR